MRSAVVIAFIALSGCTASIHAPRDTISNQAPQAALDDGQAAFMGAVRARDLARVQTMLRARPDLAATRTDFASALMFAVFARAEGRTAFHAPRDNPLVLAIASYRGDDLDIFEATVTGNRRRVEALVEADPNIARAVAPSGWTPLHFAAFSGDAALVQYLVDAGADVDARAMRSFGITPLNAGVDLQQFDAVEVLLRNGADALTRSRGGFSPMHTAASHGDLRLIRRLHEAGAELNARTNDGQTPEEAAAED